MTDVGRVVAVLEISKYPDSAQNDFQTNYLRMKIVLVPSVLGGYLRNLI